MHTLFHCRWSSRCIWEDSTSSHCLPLSSGSKSSAPGSFWRWLEDFCWSVFGIHQHFEKSLVLTGCPISHQVVCLFTLICSKGIQKIKNLGPLSYLLHFYLFIFLQLIFNRLTLTFDLKHFLYYISIVSFTEFWGCLSCLNTASHLNLTQETTGVFLVLFISVSLSF